MKVAIIGSGISGLTVGATLARAGHQVDLFEQFHRAGGVTAPYLRDGYRWDLGQLIVEGLGPDEPVGQEYLPPEFVSNLRTVPLMDSVFMVHLGVDFDPSPFVHGVCTYYYGTYDLARGLADARAGTYHGGRDGFVIHIPSLHSPEMAPLGHHAMTIYTICPDTLRDADWQERREEAATWMTHPQQGEPVRSYRSKTGRLSGALLRFLCYNRANSGCVPGVLTAQPWRSGHTT